MALRGNQIKAIQEALLNGFDDEHLEMMVRLELDEQLSAIAGGKTLTLRIYNLILWADRTGCVETLVRAAHASNPNNKQLKELVDLLEGWFESDSLQNIPTLPESHRQPFESEVFLMPPSNIWNMVRDLQGQTIETKRGAKFRITKVTDDAVYYDPENTNHAGSHSSSRSAIEHVANRHNEIGQKAPIKDVEKVLKGTEYETIEMMCHSYIYGILKKIGAVR
ncbi:MAG: effector-associated domain EAD1-containing protein [Caldilineaceae bacterium]